MALAGKEGLREDHIRIYFIYLYISIYIYIWYTGENVDEGKREVYKRERARWWWQLAGHKLRVDLPYRQIIDFSREHVSKVTNRVPKSEKDYDKTPWEKELCTMHVYKQQAKPKCALFFLYLIKLIIVFVRLQFVRI